MYVTTYVLGVLDVDPCAASAGKRGERRRGQEENGGAGISAPVQHLHHNASVSARPVGPAEAPHHVPPPAGGAVVPEAVRDSAEHVGRRELVLAVPVALCSCKELTK